MSLQEKLIKNEKEAYKRFSEGAKSFIGVKLNQEEQEWIDSGKKLKDLYKNKQ